MSTTILTDTLTPYFQLIAERPALFAQNGWPHIIKDEAALKIYIKNTGTPLGVLYKSAYNMLIVDLVEEKDGFRHPYERILPTTARGAVVIVPRYEGKFVLLHQFRHSIRESLWAFPRGFGEPGLTPEQNAAKELKEELGVSPLSPMRHLGQVIADSGLYASYADVFTCAIPQPLLEKNYEGIETIRAFSPTDLDHMIQTGQLTDGYTLAAYALYSKGQMDHF